MKRSIVLVIACLFAVVLSGCASLNNAGTAEYSVKPFTDSAGAITCCEVSVKNGKEIASLEAHISKQGDNYTVDLKEQGVMAFQGQQIAAGATQSAIDAAARIAVAAALAPIMPSLLPAAGAALASPGIGAAALGAAAGITVDKTLGSGTPQK
jgi:hypothetical protein